MAKTIDKKTNKEIENEKDPQKKMLLQKDFDWYLTYDKKRYDYVLRRERKFMYEKRWIDIKRRCYYDKLNNEYVYPLDESLKIKKYQHISNKDKQAVLEMVAIEKMTFDQVKAAFENCISNATIHNLIKSQIPNIVTYSITNPQLFKFIYIDIDDTYLQLRINNKGVKYKFKVIHLYQDYDVINNKFINEIKMVIVTKCNALEIDDKSLTLKQINAVIAKNYGDRCNFKVFVSSDGARDLKAIAERLNATHALDRFHAISWIEHAFKTEQLKQINWLLNDSANKDSYKINLKSKF